MIDPLFVKQLIQVVAEKQPIRFPYQGCDRLVAPTLLAKNNDDRLFLQGLQFGGNSSKGPITEPQWRVFYLDEMPGFITEKADWPQVLVKKEGEIVQAYKPPKFVKEILALTPDAKTE